MNNFSIIIRKLLKNKKDNKKKINKNYLDISGLFLYPNKRSWTFL